MREPEDANGPGQGKVTAMGIPCVRLQSDMMCYLLDQCDLGLGSRLFWYQSMTAYRITKPNWSKSSDTSILHHVSLLSFIVFSINIILCGAILMHFLS